MTGASTTCWEGAMKGVGYKSRDDRLTRGFKGHWWERVRSGNVIREMSLSRRQINVIRWVSTIGTLICHGLITSPEAEFEYMHELSTEIHQMDEKFVPELRNWAVLLNVHHEEQCRETGRQTVQHTVYNCWQVWAPQSRDRRCSIGGSPRPR